MTSSISILFKQHIQARQLVVINTPRESYNPLKNLKKTFNDTSAYVAFRSKQNMDYAFLMNFATNHSDYFLMLEDDVKCAPEFVTQIVTTLSAWERKFWHVGSYSSFDGKFNILKDKEFEDDDIGLPKLLTVGISSVQRPQGSYLLHTLQSLFQVSSEAELKSIVVLVHLSDPDPEWLSQTVANISDLFNLHIEARKLLVVHGLLDNSPLKNINQYSSCEELYFRQKVDYALLMNFASNLSDYFLLMDDHVQYTFYFVSAIYWALSAWKEFPWVILEFSSLRFSGKVFHSRDLSHLASFFLLFPRNTSASMLLSRFHLLLAQNVPIHLSPSMFHHMGNYSELEDTCFPVEKDKVFGEPDNPTAIVVTDMMSILNIVPLYAYVLNEEPYTTLDPEKGNHLTVILDRPQKIIRIVVLTGIEENGMYRLQKGRVLLGYDIMEHSKRCVRYFLLGPLVRGNLDQRVFYDEDSMEKLSCIRLEVSESQQWLVIRQIKVWTDPEDEES
ncbi:alpha-1,3-mannosyl-glycoprotein 4-beta-N-acetylglucosaminyltransferase-like protein MGAT4E [Marmota marmota marmota]|uniref:alpha-1,3-mannosyl-glycoprotein 4-beta-N-acetylglucosaminyltransferase-like protein MGAT4E n=1 Tax=Marmota marmota marmota TaxID=9994 RepID=UPI002093F866|nr:alpha-1,3-mannosyl-glycoprotein 4-beta-N-acetylglucosaminyltransferase-like protein MGAT4E [Marmota marmota marmota]